MEQARLQINERLRTFSQIEWWGQFEELASGQSEFPEAIRKWYRELIEAGVEDSAHYLSESPQFQ
jgi:hypothetical protein